MPDRIFLDKQTPTAFKALTSTATEIRAKAREIGLNRVLVELVKDRKTHV